MLSPAAARLSVIVAALLFSTGGMAIKMTQLGGWQVACLRSAIAAVALFTFVPGARPPWSVRAALVGLAQGATLVLFVLANKLTTAASTIFLQSAAPLYVLVLGPLFLRERIGRRDVVFMAILAGGLASFALDPGSPSATAANPTLGNALAALSGLTWAATIMGMRSVGVRGAGVTAGAQAAALGNALAALGTLPLALPLGPVAAADLAVVAALGVFQIGLAYTLLSAGVQRLRALETSILLLIEPALNPLWAWLVLAETPGHWALVGGAVIVGATLAKTWLDARRPRVAAGPDAGPGT